MRDEHGAVRHTGPGWFVLDIADAVWKRDSLTTAAQLQGHRPFDQYGITVDRLQPGRPSTSYHREFWADETFIVIEGSCTALVEGQERSMQAGCVLHAPAGTAHAFVGGPDGCTMIGIGARGVVPDGEQWGIYEADPVAARHGACVETDTPSPAVAYADNAEPVQVEPAWRPTT